MRCAPKEHTHLFCDAKKQVPLLLETSVLPSEWPFVALLKVILVPEHTLRLE
jgi:hypothetical protein